MTDVRVKICGITTREDALAALEAGADYLGFNLYPKSPRYISPEKVRELRLEMGDWASQSPIPNSQSPRFVGIFVNETVEQVNSILALTGLDYAQLHGDEPPEFLQRVAGKAFKALRPVDPESARSAAARFASAGLDSGRDGGLDGGWDDGPQLLIDAYDPAEYGGTGKKADWGVAAELARHYPRLMLAGGLTPANVARAIHTVRPWAVDVSSGVEISPGRKDHNAMRAFIQATRS